MVGVVSSMLETKTWRKYRGEYYHHLLEYHGAKATVFLAVLLSTGLISCGDVDDDVRRTAFYRIIKIFSYKIYNRESWIHSKTQRRFFQLIA